MFSMEPNTNKSKGSFKQEENKQEENKQEENMLSG